MQLFCIAFRLLSFVGIRYPVTAPSDADETSRAYFAMMLLISE